MLDIAIAKALTASILDSGKQLVAYVIIIVINSKASYKLATGIPHIHKASTSYFTSTLAVTGCKPWLVGIVEVIVVSLMIGISEVSLLVVQFEVRFLELLLQARKLLILVPAIPIIITAAVKLSK